MKTTILLFISAIAGCIAFPVSFYRFSAIIPMQTPHFIVFGMIMMVMLISLIFYTRRLILELKGIPAGDEMTVQLARIAAYKSFPYTIGNWVGVLVIALFFNNAVMLISLGILVMALTYGGFWIYYKTKGISDDESHS